MVKQPFAILGAEKALAEKNEKDKQSASQDETLQRLHFFISFPK